MSPSPQTPLLRESVRQFVRLSGGGDGGDGTNTISGQLALRPSLARVSLKKSRNRSEKTGLLEGRNSVNFILTIMALCDKGIQLIASDLICQT